MENVFRKLCESYGLHNPLSDSTIHSIIKKFQENGTIGRIIENFWKTDSEKDQKVVVIDLNVEVLLKTLKQPLVGIHE